MAKKKMPRMIDQIEYHLDEARGHWEYPLALFEKRADRRAVPGEPADPAGVRHLIVPTRLTTVAAARSERAKAAACAAAAGGSSSALKAALSIYAAVSGALLVGALGANGFWNAWAWFAPMAALTIAVILAVGAGNEHREIACEELVWAERLRRYDERIEALAGTQRPQHPYPPVNHRRGFRLRWRQRG